MKLTGWGQYPVIEANVFTPKTLNEIIEFVNKGELIARGNGRAYGDSAINSVATLHMKHFNKIIEFNNQTGELIAEAGVLLADIVSTYILKGWFPYVTPGTKFVTLGGMIATDVHGKNHHKKGSFSQFVNWIEIVNSDGQVCRCSNDNNKDLFLWTLGGMGLTGIILKASITLKKIESSFIEQTTMTANNINHAIEILNNEINSSYSVAWVDCFKKGPGLGRSVVMLGEHALLDDLPDSFKKIFKIKKRKFNIPFNFPGWFLNKFILKLYNSFYYYWKKNRQRKAFVDYESYFYPLDSILNWNRIYGKRGFIQFQCVIPKLNSQSGINEIINEISESNTRPYLAVLKNFGLQTGYFSFPEEGLTLSLDFPVNKKTLVLIDRLDSITIKYGGRFYLAKDSHISQQTLLLSDSRVQKFTTWRQKSGASRVFNSSQSDRLKI